MSVFNFEGTQKAEHVALAVQALLEGDAFIFPGQLNWTVSIWLFMLIVTGNTDAALDFQI